MKKSFAEERIISRLREAEAGVAKDLWPRLGFSEAHCSNKRDTFDGIQYDTIKMTLYKVADGNMHTTRIPMSEF